MGMNSRTFHWLRRKLLDEPVRKYPHLSMPWMLIYSPVSLLGRAVTCKTVLGC